MSNDIETSTVTDPGTPPAGDSAETTLQGGTPQGGEGAPAGDGTTPPGDWRAGLPEGWGEKLKDVGSAARPSGPGTRPWLPPGGNASRTRPEYPDKASRGRSTRAEERFPPVLRGQRYHSPDQAQKLLDWQLGANKEITDKIIADGVKELRSEWGSRFEENKATALKAFTALDKRMGGRLATSIEGRDMAQQPLMFVRAFHEIASCCPKMSCPAAVVPLPPMPGRVRSIPTRACSMRKGHGRCTDRSKRSPT